MFLISVIIEDVFVLLMFRSKRKFVKISILKQDITQESLNYECIFR